MFFPECIDDYVSADAPVRAYDAIIEAMNLNQMGFELDRHKVGCPQYDPKVMLKLLVYGFPTACAAVANWSVHVITTPRSCG
jgi:transposase